MSFDNGLLFEHYGDYVQNEENDLQTPTGAARLLRDDAQFNDFADNLTEGLDASSSYAVKNILGQQREFLLSESANVASSVFTHGWTVMSFPILVDIYAEPIISQVMNVYATSTPTLSIPYVRIKSDTIGFDGEIQKSYVMPTPHHLVRPGFIEAEAGPGISDLFELANLTNQGLIMNRRYTLVEGVKITAKADDGTEHEIVVDCMLRPDARDHVSGDAATIEFTGPAGTPDEGKLHRLNISLHFNYDNGQVTNSGIMIPAEDAELTYEYTAAKIALKFTAKNSDKGRTIVHVENEMTDITIDPNEDFMISLTTEELQDYRSIFKIDLARTLSEAIKRQILLNKDFDLAYMLKTHEPALKAEGGYFNVDLTQYNSSANAYTPNNVYDVMKGLIPYISSAISSVYRRMQMYPEFLVCGVTVATLIRSMQQFMVTMSNQQGGIGWAGEAAQFLKLKVLESFSLDANGSTSKMYLLTKAPENQLEKTIIADLVYQPLYITSEVTNGLQKNYVRSRTLVHVCRTNGIACIEISGTQALLGR